MWPNRQSGILLEIDGDGYCLASPADAGRIVPGALQRPGEAQLLSPERAFDFRFAAIAAGRGVDRWLLVLRRK
jgi:hypothetical protein